MPRIVPYLPDTAPFTPEQRAWLNGFFAALASADEPTAALAALPFAPPTPAGFEGDGRAGTAPAAEPAPRYDRNRPSPAPLAACRRLSAPGSAKDTRHVEIALEGSGLAYEPGDALGVVPQNCPDLVAALVAVLGAT